MYINDIVKTKTVFPLVAADLKDQLNIDSDFTDDDALIDKKIKAAFLDAEKVTGRDILVTVNELEIEEFSGTELTIDECPYHSIDTITVFDSEDVETVIDVATLKVRRRKISFKIIFPENVDAYRLVIVFKTGYEILPENVTEAIAIKVNDLYDIERTSMVVGVNFRNTEAFNHLLSGLVVNRW